MGEGSSDVKRARTAEPTASSTHEAHGAADDAPDDGSAGGTGSVEGVYMAALPPIGQPELEAILVRLSARLVADPRLTQCMRMHMHSMHASSYLQSSSARTLLCA